MPLDGLDAYELEADAVHSTTGEPLRLYQMIAREAHGYVIAQGLVGAPRAEEYGPEFRRITHSFRQVQR